MTFMYRPPTLLHLLFLSLLLLLSRFILRMSESLTLHYMLSSPTPPLSLHQLILFLYRNHGTGASELTLKWPKETQSLTSTAALNIGTGKPFFPLLAPLPHLLTSSLTSPPIEPPGLSNNGPTSSPIPQSYALRSNRAHTPS